METKLMIALIIVWVVGFILTTVHLFDEEIKIFLRNRKEKKKK